MKTTLLAKFINFLLHTEFGNGYSICSGILSIIIFGVSAQSCALIFCLFLLAFIFFIIIMKADYLKKLLEIEKDENQL